jgi:hypothetical protein
MVEKESYPYPHLPPLPDPWPRPPDVVPAAASLPVDAGGEPAPAVEAAVPTPATVETPASGEAKESERITLMGRVGRDPTVWTTKTGIPRAQFPLAVRHDPRSDKTTWHRIDAWNKWAERARDTVHKGDMLEVVAYRRVTTVEGARGPREVEELRAAAIRHPKA